MTEQQRRSAAVIGAGLAGSSAALGFLDAGFGVTLYSDKDRAALRDDVPPTGSAVYFGKSREADARIIEDLYGEESLTTGLSTRLHTGYGDDRGEILEFDPEFGYFAQAVDVRLRAADRIDRFVDRGGVFEVRKVTVDDVDAIAAKHDLTLVATGKGGLVSLFPVDEERTVYRTPQRSLLLVTLHAKSDRPDFAYRTQNGRLHNLFNLHTDFGEAWLGPFLHKDAGPSWSFLGFAKPGSPWEERFAKATDARSARNVVVDFYREFFPNEAPEIEKLESIDADPYSWLRGAVTPTVRTAVGITKSGHPVAAIGDAAITFDPLAGQGAQNAIVQVAALVAAAESQKGEFDTDWLREQFDRHWEARGNAAAEVTRLFLGDPKYATHAELLFPAAAVSEAVAAALFGFLSEPEKLLGLSSREDVLAFISGIAGEAAEDVLSRFNLSSGFTASPLAPARV
ncbi:styrene monooxygenase/indole monooxygenase family protein [Hoyosella subflava]|uniref:Possible monooxygenase n=1 Tax=Hoyosella subflava (strain DSM 45089 / JCM 17490 / NBRC 109087 / DQS3-9A1) TaxID=443218 RepID=F6EGT9_HOYSD|nr:styrene monooxygenase/indole monooxygenase family protein [Hoyosella subflava]AEF42327.1 Possible monooxygenase [Hoyosella subflava DQS3-9A1]